MKFAIKVVWNDGEEEFLKLGQSNTPAPYTSRSKAKEQVEFMRMGMDGECQSINVVPYPAGAAQPGDDKPETK